MTPLDRQTLRRLAVVFALFAGFSIVLLGRLTYWSALPHPDLLAADRTNQLQPGRIAAGRGAIYDRHGRLLAGDVVDYWVILNPRLIASGKPTAVGDTALRLSRILARPELEIRTLIEKGKDARNRSYAPLGGGFSEEQIRTLRAAKIDGVTVEERPKRVYPMESLAAHVLGFVNADRAGAYGVEQFYDNALRGEPGTTGGALLIDPRYFRAPRDGYDIYLTIDAHIQAIAERELAKAIAAQDAAGGTAIIMVPDTGEILAMASIPTFNPNQFSSTPVDRFTNAAISRLYEPGSVIKTMTLAAALEEGVATLDTTYNDASHIRVGGFTIWNWDRVAHGVVDMRTMIRLSLNVGAVHLGFRLQPDRFYRYMRAFGYGEPTGIDLTGEVGGLIRDHTTSKWGELDLATNSFGQGMAATPIQVATATAALANGGHLLQPRVLHQIRKGDRIVKDTTAIPRRRVVSPTTAAQTAEAMIGVIEQAVRGKVPGYTVAGKTGSSQIPTEKGYDPELTIASFAGFGPVENPRVVVFVKVDKPTHRQLGSEVAAPFFGAVTRQLFEYMDIPPDSVRLGQTARGTEGRR